MLHNYFSFKHGTMCLFSTRDVEVAISSTASASTPIASASNRAWTLSHL